MEVAGTQLVEKDIENLARGERGRPRGAEGAAAAGPDGRGPPPAPRRGSGSSCFPQE